MGRASGENGLVMCEHIVHDETVSLTDVEDSFPGMRHRSSSRTSSGESVRWTTGHGVPGEGATADVDDGSGCGKENMSWKTAERLARIPL